MPGQNSGSGQGGTVNVADLTKLFHDLIQRLPGAAQGVAGGGGGGSVPLSEYNLALGNFLKFPGGDLKQTYSDVLMQVYPLQADLKVLQGFCDKYFWGENSPAESRPIEIRVVAPLVLMVICDYGKMALKTQNIGWVSQHELAFGFPVALYNCDQQGNKQFTDWALVYPFIYVDNPLSMSLGRQVYGWPKAGIEIRSARPNLSPDLRSLATVDLYSGPERGAVGDPADTRFLEVFQRQYILSGRAGAASYINYLARMSADYMSLLSAGFGMVRNAGYDWRKNPPQTMDAMVGQYGSMTAQYFTWYDYLDGFLKSASRMARTRQEALQRPFGNQADKDAANVGNAKADPQLGEIKTITLKQFRDAENPRVSCYRAIVVSTMGYCQPTDGALFVSDPLSPDISGGVLINLYSRAPGSAVVESLGIQGATRVVRDGSKTIHTLQPVMPFWAKLDLNCGSGDSQWSRDKYTGWSFDDKPRDGGLQPGGLAQHTQGPQDSKPVPYTTVGSGATQELRGPLQSANFGLRVFALKARKATLQDLCNKYLGLPLGQSIFEFQVKDPPKEMQPMLPKDADACVLMLVSSFDGLSGEGRGAEGKNLHDRVLTFAVPATLIYKGKEADHKDKEKDVLIPLYTFVEQDWDFLTEYEVYGRLAFKSDLQSPPENWVDASKDRSELLTACTTIFPGEGQEPQSARVMPLVQIWKSRSDRLSPLLERHSSRTDEVFEASLASQLRSQQDLVKGYRELMGLPDPHLAGVTPPIASIGLKQIRDAISPNSASYQEIVLVNRSFSSGWTFPAEEPKLTVYIYKYGEEFDLAKIMGLIPQKSEPEPVVLSGEPHARYVFETIPGARAYGQMDEESAKGLCWSTSSGIWTEARDTTRVLAPFRDS
jgi:hypothetical protein